MKKRELNNFTEELFDKDTYVSPIVFVLLGIALLFGLIIIFFRSLPYNIVNRKEKKGMKLHTLKIEKKYIDDVMLGIKKSELRFNDRGYQVGDLIHFVTVKGKEFKNRESNLFVITHILKGCESYGLSQFYVILSIKRINNY